MLINIWYLRDMLIYLLILASPRCSTIISMAKMIPSMVELQNWYCPESLVLNCISLAAASTKFQMFCTQMEIRKCQDIHSRSAVKILEASSDLYSAIVDDKLCMKIGDGSWCPSGPEWKLAASGDRYAVWHK